MYIYIYIEIRPFSYLGFWKFPSRGRTNFELVYATKIYTPPIDVYSV